MFLRLEEFPVATLLAFRSGGQVVVEHPIRLLDLFQLNGEPLPGVLFKLGFTLEPFDFGDADPLALLGAIKDDVAHGLGGRGRGQGKQDRVGQLRCNIMLHQAWPKILPELHAAQGMLAVQARQTRLAPLAEGGIVAVEMIAGFAQGLPDAHHALHGHAHAHLDAARTPLQDLVVRLGQVAHTRSFHRRNRSW